MATNNSLDYPGNDPELYNRFAAAIASGIGVFLATTLNLLNLMILPKIPNRFGENGIFCLQCLAVVDILGGVSCFGSRFIFEIKRSIFLSNLVWCNAVGASCTVFVSQSTWILCAISFDRFIAVTKPLYYTTLLTLRKMKIILALAMVIGLITAGTRTTQIALQGSCDFDRGAQHYANVPLLTLYSSLVFVCGTVSTVLNFQLLTIARKHRSRIVDEAVRFNNMALTASINNVPVAHASRPSYRGAVTIAMLVGTFYLVWTPHSIGTIVAAVTGSALPEAAYFTMVWMAFSNHWINAMIYFLLSKSYRVAILDLLKMRRDPFNTHSAEEISDVRTISVMVSQS